MEKHQLEVLQRLFAALTEATDTGVLDILCGEIHPDTINAFCDGVAAELKAQAVLKDAN